MSIKQLFSLSLIALVSFACDQNSSKDAKEHVITEDVQNIDKEKTLNAEQKEKVQHKTAVAKDVILSLYVGVFRSKKMNDKKNPMLENKISISLDSISNDVLFGHSVVAGNNRSFTGKFIKKDGLYIAECKEPGDDKYDGVFTFTLNPQDESIKGAWTSNDKKLAVTERSYDLKKVEFKYNPHQELGDISVEVYQSSNANTDEFERITSDAGKFNASTTLLKKEDVENMYKRDLEVMRNAIYARHGYSFKNRQMRNFFDAYVDWYIPVSTDVSKDLTDIEKKNIDLIKRYEKHAETYYDVYGR